MQLNLSDQLLIFHFDRVVMIQDREPLDDENSTMLHIPHRHHTNDLMVHSTHQYLHPMNESTNYMFEMLNYWQMVVMRTMLVYNRDCANDSIEFDRMDFDVSDVQRLEMEAGNRVVENRLCPNSMQQESMRMMKLLD